MVLTLDSRAWRSLARCSFAAQCLVRGVGGERKMTMYSRGTMDIKWGGGMLVGQ